MAFCFVEEGSLLGQWLENIMSESTTSRVEPKKDKVEDGKSEVAYTQSLDIVCFQLYLTDNVFPVLSLCCYSLLDPVSKSFIFN